MRSQLKTILLLGALSTLVVAGAAAFGPTAAWIGAGVALALNAGAYFWSDRLVLRMHGARELADRDAPHLHVAIRDLAVRAAIPVPRLYLVEDAQPNAFATGRSPAHAAVAVTTGLLALLDRRELRAVLAHEMAHVKNRDVLLSTIAATLAAALTWAPHALSLSALLGRSGDGAEGEGEGGGAGALLLAVVAPIAGLLVQLGISRAREHAADETGARLCGDPDALADALVKLERGAAMFPAADPRPATASLFIVNPLLGGGRLAQLFATHPATEERVRRLRRLAGAARRDPLAFDPFGALG